MSWWSNLWNKGGDDKNNKTTTRPTDTPMVDYTEQIVVNKALTRGLYDNTASGYKLAGALAGPPIDVPLNFMGVPLPIINNSDEQQKYVNSLMRKFNKTFKEIAKQCHRDGTIWIWPWYDSKKGEPRVEFIDDDWVTEVYRDLVRGDITGIKVVKHISVMNESGNVVSATQTRVFTTSKITTTYTNSQVSGLKNSVQRNPIGCIPVVFANKKDGDNVRGKSDYTRILPDLNDYHRTSLRKSIELNDFTTKLIQNVDNVQQWACNQGYDDLNHWINNANPQKAKFVLNEGDEKTEYLFNKGMIEGYLLSMKNSFFKIVEGSGLPEMFWGLIHVGNHATAENDMTTLIQLVTNKREQNEDSYLQLIGYLVQLDSLSKNEVFTENIELSWSQLDAVSESTRAEIFKNFCEGISKAWTSGCMTIDQVRSFWVMNYPGSDIPSEEEFENSLVKSAKLISVQRADYEELLGVNPLTNNE